MIPNVSVQSASPHLVALLPHVLQEAGLHMTAWARQHVPVLLL